MEEEINEDDEHILEAERMGIVSNSPTEIKGLVKEASVRIERGDKLVRGESLTLSKKSSKSLKKSSVEKDKGGDEFNDD